MLGFCDEIEIHKCRGSNRYNTLICTVRITPKHDDLDVAFLCKSKKSRTTKPHCFPGYNAFINCLYIYTGIH